MILAGLASLDLPVEVVRVYVLTDELVAAAECVVKSYRAHGGYTVPLSINLRRLGDAVREWQECISALRLDSDNNGWIDENDAAFSELRVWTKDSSGKDQLSTLKQSKVGALNVASIATPFDIKDSSNALQGQIRASGIFLQEDGKAGTLQQIDLTV